MTVTPAACVAAAPTESIQARRTSKGDQMRSVSVCIEPTMRLGRQLVAGPQRWISQTTRVLCGGWFDDVAATAAAIASAARAWSMGDLLRSLSAAWRASWRSGSMIPAVPTGPPDDWKVDLSNDRAAR